MSLSILVRVPRLCPRHWEGSELQIATGEGASSLSQPKNQLHPPRPVSTLPNALSLEQALNPAVFGEPVAWEGIVLPGE